MREAAVERKRALAEAVSAALAQMPDVIAVCLFGSVARGTATGGSDIDLLVLGADSVLTPSALRWHLPAELREADPALSSFTIPSLRAYLRQWSRFGVHLRREAVILHDPTGALREILAERIPVSVASELEAQRRHLMHYSHVHRFGGRLLFPLAHIYRIGRTVVFAMLAQRGRLEFDREVAFHEMRQREPSLSEEIRLIEQLAPFYDRVRRQDVAGALPFSPVGPEAEVRFVKARDAVAHLLALNATRL